MASVAGRIKKMRNPNDPIAIVLTLKAENL
jgi:hypothetical protein